MPCRGSCVVSTCEELAYPFRKYPELAAKLDAEAKDGGVALIGTGINPGFVMDKLSDHVQRRVAANRIRARGRASWMRPSAACRSRKKWARE